MKLTGFVRILSGKTYFNQGKIREISGNFIPQNLWPSCLSENALGRWSFESKPREDAGGLSREYVLRIPSVS